MKPLAAFTADARASLFSAPDPDAADEFAAAVLLAAIAALPGCDLGRSRSMPMPSFGSPLSGVARADRYLKRRRKRPAKPPRASPHRCLEQMARLTSATARIWTHRHSSPLSPRPPGGAGMQTEAHSPDMPRGRVQHQMWSLRPRRPAWPQPRNPADKQRRTLDDIVRIRGQDVHPPLVQHLRRPI